MPKTVEDRQLSDSLKTRILNVLEDRFKGISLVAATYISEPERRNAIIRLHFIGGGENAPGSLIFKQSLPSQSNPQASTDVRFLRDWAGSAFISERQAAEGQSISAKFYGEDVESRFILIEDLGDNHISLVDSLTRDDSEMATAALSRYMRALANFNVLSVGYVERYNEILSSITLSATLTEKDIHLARFQSIAVNVATKDAFLQDIHDVLSANFDLGPFSVLTHGDIAPDNVFDLGDDSGLKLIDFEHAMVRSALIDGVYPRMSMPTAWCAKKIPETVLAPQEANYRQILAQKIPAAEDEVLYSTAYTHACAFYALQMMAEYKNWRNLTAGNDSWGDGPLPEGSLWTASTNSLRARFITRLETFCHVAKVHDELMDLKGSQNPDDAHSTLILPALQKEAEAMLEEAYANPHWHDVKGLDDYPAFNPEPYHTEQRRIAKNEQKQDLSYHLMHMFMGVHRRQAMIYGAQNACAQDDNFEAATFNETALINGEESLTIEQNSLRPKVEHTSKEDGERAENSEDPPKPLTFH